MSTVLVTGGAGFIGSRLVHLLLGAGHSVTVLDNLSPQIHGPNPEHSPLYGSIRGRVKFIRGDVTNREDWSRSLTGQEVIVHLAAETGTGQSMYQIERYSSVNVRGTALMLDLLANEKHSVRRVVIASSRAVYGEGQYSCGACGDVYPDTRRTQRLTAGEFEPQCPRCGGCVAVRPTVESAPFRPASIYGITKQTQEQLVASCCTALGIPYVVFRYQNVYGPGQSLANPYTGILSVFSTRILNGNAIDIYEDGEESRDFVLVDDVAAATLMGVEHNGIDGCALNVGTGRGVTVREVADLLCKLYGIDVPIAVSGRFRPGDIRHAIADTSKVSKVLGFKPQIAFEDGLARFASWVKTQSVETDRYDESVEEMDRRGLMGRKR